jgi:hypothetical protein
LDPDIGKMDELEAMAAQLDSKPKVGRGTSAVRRAVTTRKTLGATRSRPTIQLPAVAEEFNAAGSAEAELDRLASSTERAKLVALEKELDAAERLVQAAEVAAEEANRQADTFGLPLESEAPAVQTPREITAPDSGGSDLLPWGVGVTATKYSLESPPTKNTDLASLVSQVQATRKDSGQSRPAGLEAIEARDAANEAATELVESARREARIAMGRRVIQTPLSIFPS